MHGLESHRCRFRKALELLGERNRQKAGVPPPQSDPINRLLFSIPLVLRVTLTFQQPRKNDAICTMDFNWPRGLMVSTLDPESSDRDSNPREAFACVEDQLVCEAEFVFRCDLKLLMWDWLLARI